MAASDVRWQLLKDDLVDQGVSGISGSRDAMREAVVRALLPAGSEDTWMARPGCWGSALRVVALARCSNSAAPARLRTCGPCCLGVSANLYGLYRFWTPSGQRPSGSVSSPSSREANRAR